MCDSVTTYRGDDPLSRVDSAVPDDCWVSALATAAPKMDALDSAALDGVANREDAGVTGEGCLEVSKVLYMGVQLPVGVEVRDVRKRSLERLDRRYECKCQHNVI